MSAASSLWIPQSARADATYTKAPAPKLGPQYGAWAGRDLTYLNFPGGATLAFDLSKLTLADYRAMEPHYQVNASTSILMFMMHQNDWQIQCDDARIAKKIDDILRPVWTRLVRGLSQAFTLGFSPNVVEYDNDGPSKSIIVSKIKDLLPEECRVNWKEVQGSPSLPGGFAPVKLYEYDGIWQTAFGRAGGANVIPADYTLWYPCLMRNGDYYGRKLLKPAFIPWFFSQLIHLFSNRYYERFGEPVPVGRADFESEVVDANGNTVNGKTAMEDILMNLRNRGVVVLPSSRTPVGNGGASEYDFDIEFLESQMRGADWERYLMRLDEEISLGMFTPLSSMRLGENGSLNQVQVHMMVYMWSLNAFSGDWKEYIDRYLIKRIKDLNFGVNAPPAQWVPKKFGKDNQETLRALVMESVRVGDVKPSAFELGEAIGITLEDISMLVRPTNVLGEDPDHPTANPSGPIPEAPTIPTSSTPPSSTPATTRQRDKRISRGSHQDRKVPKSGDAGVIRHKLAERITAQFQKAKYDGVEQFDPDLGFRRQFADVVGDADEADEILYRLEVWATDVFPVVDLTSEFRSMFETVLEGELV